MIHQVALSDEERSKRLKQVKELIELQQFNVRKTKAMQKEEALR